MYSPSRSGVAKKARPWLMRAICSTNALNSSPRSSMNVLIVIPWRVQREADHVQVVARELALDERVQRQRHFLGGQEAAAEDHGPAHVQHQDRGGLRLQLGAVHGEVLLL